MPQGLQIWDENGNNILDTNSSTVKMLGVFKYDSSPVVLTHNLLATQNRFYMVFPPTRGAPTNDLKVVFSGNKATVYNTRQTNYKKIYVGVY